MSKQTTLWLVFLVLALGLGVWWQRDREHGSLRLIVPLFEGIEVSRVQSIRVDNSERGLNVKLERDADGRWFLTDPIAYPADEALMRLLLEIITSNQCTPVPELERDADALGLERPRVILEIEEVLPEGPRRQRIEVGSVDFDGERVNVRVRGQMLRTPRNLDSTLQRDLPDYRSRRALELYPAASVQVLREGEIFLELAQPAIDLRFLAINEGQTWRATQPVAAAVDPAVMHSLLAAAAGLQVDSFFDDNPTDLEPYGLHNPNLRLEVLTVNGETQTLLLSRDLPGGVWYCMREGFPHVWTVSEFKALPFCVPFEVLLDRRLVRALRDDVLGLRLESSERSLRLWREGEDWLVAQGPAGTRELSSGVPADVQMVGEILGRLEREELMDFLVGESFEPAPGAERLIVETIQGEQGGAFGAIEPGRLSVGGGELRRFRRRGDRAVSLVSADLIELVDKTLPELKSLKLLKVEEREIERLRFARADQALEYERDRRGIWVPVGSLEEAQELYLILDQLLFLRAEENLGAVTQPLEDVIEVRLTTQRGVSLELELGRLAQGDAAAVDLAGQRARLPLVTHEGRETDLQRLIRDLFE